jgi:outer membrane protein assembly factor BamB
MGKSRLLEKPHALVSYLLLAGCTAILVWWLTYDPSRHFGLSLPGMDNRSDSTLVQEEVAIGAHFERFSDAASSSTESWPRFRGADFDNISKSKVRLIDKFPASGPKVVWTHGLGEGHAGAAIYQGLVYILDYDEETRADMLRCFELSTGQEVWEAMVRR